MRRRIYATLLCVLGTVVLLQGQTSTAKYPSIFWEITGNGLKKPSYLFGTMHVSSKLVFHLSDSFYNAIQNVDMVALELNPNHWQRDLVKLTASQVNINQYMQYGANDYLNETSFQLEKYEDNLRQALAEEPSQINGLLYRTYQTQADFEENTYLDLYIFQTGRKLGKLAGGVEDYYQSQRIMFEAYQDMAKEKNRKKPDTDGESMYDIERKLQDAYRRGDLDLLDSLEKFTFNSPAYMEKFLYLRNEIQANSIDTILKNHSLFVGVGAAHLPGPRGVIELLRKKGYKLRPVHMQDRDADRKDVVDKMKVPVQFQTTSTDDGFIQMQMPGKLYKRSDNRYSTIESWQYADMDNGTYYMLSRVKTHAAMLGQTTNEVKKKVDSLLYENIPGRILEKKSIIKNGYTGFDITNRTRRGDIQRYNILVTPVEVLVFKMSGNDEYVKGKEADTFFNSITVKNPDKHAQVFETGTGGFKVNMPQQPYQNVSNAAKDRLTAWQYEAVDSATGNAYLIWKKTVNNYRFLEEDTFDLSLIEESFKRSEYISKEVSRSFGLHNNYHALNMTFTLKSGGNIYAKAILRGAHYYLLAVRSEQKKYDPEKFFSSFSFTDFQYAAPALFKDTSLHFEVQTPVQPKLDPELMKMINETLSDDFLSQVKDSYSYGSKDSYAFFNSDSTGEAVQVSITKYPKYYYSKDSAKFWRSAIKDKYFESMIVKEKTPIKWNNASSGYKVVLRDTNTVRQVTIFYLLKDNRLFRFSCLTDTIGKESGFIKSFTASFKPEEKSFGPSVFTNKQAAFFDDFYAKDSTTKKRAEQALSNINFSCSDLSQMKKALANLKYGDKNYFELKTKFITELGNIDDSTCANELQAYLADLYQKTSDTSYFQNEILQSLAKIKTQESYTTLKKLILQDPPVFDDEDDYASLFEYFKDTLVLSKNLFPDVLQLATVQDYKEPLNDLLREMVDSNLISAAEYEPYYSSLYFDAKIELKKQQNKDEKLLEKESQQDDDELANDFNGKYNRRVSSSSNLSDYSVLLLPFYNQHSAVQKYFDKLLQSKDVQTQMKTAVLLAKSNISLPDSLLLNIASKDLYRARLLEELEEINKSSLFPKKYKHQEDVARSVLLNDKNDEKFAAIELAGKEKVTLNNKTGWIYFFKYKLKANDDWKIGISGLQPLKDDEVSSNDDLTSMTNKKLNYNEPAIDQFRDQLKKLIFSTHESARSFFSDNRYNYFNMSLNDDDDAH